MAPPVHELRHVLARNVATARAAHGITQEELASAAGVSRATVIQIESGEADSKLSTLGDITKALKTSAVMLLMGSHELAALSEMLSHPEHVQGMLANVAEGTVRPVADLPRAEKKAGKTGDAVARAAGLGVSTSVGAAIGTLAVPGIGTAIGAAFGLLVDRAKRPTTRPSKVDSEAGRSNIDNVVEKLVVLGVPGIVLLFAISASGLAGGAAIVVALASLGGPFGMLGGIAMLGIMTLVANAVAKHGVATIFKAVVSGLVEKGTSKNEIRKTIEGYPISKGLKREIIDRLKTVESMENPLMYPLPRAEMRVFIHAMCAVAWADRVVQDEERKLIGEFAQASELPEENKREAAGWLATPVALDDVAWTQLRPYLQAFVYRSAIKVMKADDKVTPTESAFLKSMAGKLLLSADEINEIDRAEHVD